VCHERRRRVVDLGYGEAQVDADLHALGVTTVAIPRKGRPNAARAQLQRSSRFTKLVKWRTGSEGRIATLKPNSGWSRTLMDGLDGASTWCSWGVLAHNATKFTTLAQANNSRTNRPAGCPAPRAEGSWPPTGPPPSTTAA
jgi:IS5 family transposase